MEWRYKIGLLLIASVVLIWVTSAEVTQSIFAAYRHPFVLTWLGASLLVVYLPVSIAREAIWKFVKGERKGSKEYFEDLNRFSPTIMSESPVKSPLRNGLRKGSDMELHHFTRKDSDLDVEGEEGRFLLQNHTNKQGAKVSGWDLVKTGFILAPLWFLTEYLSNAALALTSVASTTILSSTAGLFTLAFGTILGQDSFNFTKAIAVIVSITGVAMTTLGKTWSTEEVEIADVNSAQHSFWGDMLGLLSAVSYGIFTILLKKHAGEEGSRVDMQRMFGYIGLFSLCAMWWLVWPLSWIGLEPSFSIPTEMKTDEVLLANGILGSVLSDYFWAMSVVWTTPLVATLGMSLTIPLAMVADMMVHGRHYSAIYILGSIQIGRSLKSESVELYVGLISVSSCFGRLVGGYGSDVLLKLTPYPRPLCLSLSHLIMTLGCLALAAGYVPLLYVGSALVGGSYGSFWALSPAILAEVFGLQNFPALYKLIGAFGPVGAFVLSAKVVGQFYDEEAEVYHVVGDAGEQTCLGRRCFEFSMLILAVVCMLGASLGAVLSIRTRQLYAQMKLHSRQ